MSGHDATDVLQQVTASALTVFEATACSIALLEGDELHYVRASGEGADGIVGTRLPVSRGLGGFAASGGEPVLVADVHTDARFAADVAESTGYMPTSLIAAPVKTVRGSYGVLTVLDPAVTGPVGERLLELVALLAHQAALQVEMSGTPPPPANQNLRAELVDRVQRLPAEQLEAAAALLRSLDHNRG